MATRRPAAAAVPATADKFLFAFSWLLVTALGLMPFVETALRRPPSLATRPVIAFFVAVASGILLRRRYTWVGLVMHIYRQVMIWLWLFAMSLTLLLCLR